MTNVRKRICRTLLWSGLCVLLIFALWVNSGFALPGAESVTRREARRYMLPEPDFLIKGADGESYYMAGDEVISTTENGYIDGFFSLDGGAALTMSPELLWRDFSFMTDAEKIMRLYAVDKVDGAAYVELELWLRRSKAYYYNADEDLERLYYPRCTDYDGTTASFVLDFSDSTALEFGMLQDLRSVITSDVSDMLSYRATLRYYDAEGNLLDEVVREEIWN